MGVRETRLLSSVKGMYGVCMYHQVELSYSTYSNALDCGPLLNSILTLNWLVKLSHVGTGHVPEDYVDHQQEPLVILLIFVSRARWSKTKKYNIILMTIAISFCFELEKMWESVGDVCVDWRPGMALSKAIDAASCKDRRRPYNMAQYWSNRAILSSARRFNSSAKLPIGQRRLIHEAE